MTQNAINGSIPLASSGRKIQLTMIQIGKHMTCDRFGPSSPVSFERRTPDNIWYRVLFCVGNFKVAPCSGEYIRNTSANKGSCSEFQHFHESAHKISEKSEQKDGQYLSISLILYCLLSTFSPSAQTQFLHQPKSYSYPWRRNSEPRRQWNLTRTVLSPNGDRSKWIISLVLQRMVRTYGTRTYQLIQSSVKTLWYEFSNSPLVAPAVLSCVLGESGF